MTPEELDLILGSGETITSNPELFSASFYATLFELAPETRVLFPVEMVEQRKKLVGELRFMIEAAVAWTTPDSLDGFVTRTHELGRRHVGYGVTASMYEPVTTALVATLQDGVAGFDEDHLRGTGDNHRENQP